MILKNSKNYLNLIELAEFLLITNMDKLFDVLDCNNDDID